MKKKYHKRGIFENMKTRKLIVSCTLNIYFENLPKSHSDKLIYSNKLTQPDLRHVNRNQ